MLAYDAALANLDAVRSPLSWFLKPKQTYCRVFALVLHQRLFHCLLGVLFLFCVFTSVTRALPFAVCFSG